MLLGHQIMCLTCILFQSKDIVVEDFGALHGRNIYDG